MHLIGVSAFLERRLDSEPVRSSKIVGSGGSSSEHVSDEVLSECMVLT